MEFTLKNEVIESVNESYKYIFPKYTSQLINWANQNAQGTRASVVGQMSELFPQFMRENELITIEEWETWYQKNILMLLIMLPKKSIPKFKICRKR